MLPHLVAALLGVGAALLAACGTGTTAGIPAANAGELKSQITDVRQAVDDGRCSDVPGQLRQVDETIDDLPPATDEQLVAQLRDGADHLRDLAQEECHASPDNETATQPTETQTTDTTTTTETETTPAETTTAPAETTTQPPATTPEQPPPPPEPPIEPQPPPPPPPATPGGGTEPQVP